MPRRVLQGTVLSNKNDKTIVVRVANNIMHPLYKKYIRVFKKYAAHDPENVCQVGDVVRIIECRPISKTKTWCLLSSEMSPPSPEPENHQVNEPPL